MLHATPLVIPQDTLPVYSFEEEADTVAPRPAPRPTTVAGILRLLPPDASPAEQDSLVQAMMKIPEPTHLSTQPDTLYLPGLKGSNPRPDISQFSATDNYFTGNALCHPEIPMRQIGMAAEPLTYRLSNDDYVTGLLLLSFFLASSFVVRNVRTLSERVKAFFRFGPDDGEYSASTNDEIRGMLFLILQTCFTVAILFFVHTQVRLTEVFNQNSPYVLLGIDAAITLAYFAAKFTAYRFVNWVFFTDAQSRRWTDSLMLCIGLTGISLFAVALLVVYFDLSYQALQIAAVLLVCAFKLLLLAKCKQIFFNYKLGGLHLILYFCTLEILPVLLLWKALVYCNETLIVNI